MGAHNARERTVADAQFGSGAGLGAPATWYLGISTTTPNEDGTGFTEPVGGSYARVTITNNSTNFPAATTVSDETRKTNGAKFTFANPTGTWGIATYWGLFTTLTGGLPEYSDPLDAAISIRNGNTPVEFDIGQWILVFD